jgi:hypothetical protein
MLDDDESAELRNMLCQKPLFGPTPRTYVARYVPAEEPPPTWAIIIRPPGEAEIRLNAKTVLIELQSDGLDLSTIGGSEYIPISRRFSITGTL